MHRVVICGKGGSGKDYLRDAIRRDGSLKCDLSITTRPPRANEEDGVAYHFYTDKEFKSLKDCGGFYEHVTFNGWQYGTLKKSWDESHVFIMTPSGIRSISPADRSRTYIIFLDIPGDIRRKRMAQRVGNADSLERRLEADEQDFSGFVNYDARIVDPNFDCQAEVLNIKHILGRFH
jgi:guanylate kinase